MHSVNFNADSFANAIIDWINHTLPRIPGVILGILVGILAVRMLSRILRFVLKLSSLQKGLRQIIASAAETLMWLLLTITVLQWLGFPNILVLFSSSTITIGILLAAGGSTLFSDLVAGIFLARDNDFNVGDELIMGENQTRGIVESMDVRRVRIRDEEGQLHVLPNTVVERKEWVLVDRGNQGTTPALVKAAQAAKRLKAVTVGDRKLPAADKKPPTTEQKTSPADQKTPISDKKAPPAKKKAAHL